MKDPEPGSANPSGLVQDRRAMGLRERKKQRTRQALTVAAHRLFAEKGYEATTVADIAAAAEVSPRTFFGYFPSKEAVLFAGTDQRLAAIDEMFDGLPPAATPMEAVRQLVEHVLDTPYDDLVGANRLERIGLVLTKPELQGQAMRHLLAAERLIAERLHAAYPDRFDETLARAAAGALVGALVGAVLQCLERGDPPDRMRTEIQRAVDLVANGLDTLG